MLFSFLRARPDDSAVPQALRDADRAGKVRRLAGLVALVAAVALLMPAAGVPAASARGTSTVFDVYADYEPQDGCVSAPLPGTSALLRHLQRTWPAVASAGTVRGCDVGGLSEHKDGRALDWAADVAVPSERAAAYTFLEQLTATDKAGNTHALARRMGVMYVIYDDTIWASYRGFEPRPYKHSACAKVKTCSRTLRHLDHVHVSLSRAGGAAQTSWYRDRNVPTLPVLLPGTRHLDYASTAVHRIEVPADGTTVATRFRLAPDTTYRLVATGRVTLTRDGRRADAVCSRSRAGTGWTATMPAPSETPTETDPDPGGWQNWGPGSPVDPSPVVRPDAASVGLVVNGRARFGADCAAGSTYESRVRFDSARRLNLTFLDPRPAGNTGTVTVWVAREDITTASLSRR